MKKVLIMEDELNIRSFVVINLRRAGYDAIEAGDGQEALDALGELTGRTAKEEIVSRIFSRFCVGK